jgi:hypothetical protein
MASHKEAQRKPTKSTPINQIKPAQPPAALVIPRQNPSQR